MATNSHFNLSKTVKRQASRIQDKNARRHYLNMMIDAEASALKAKGMKWSDPATKQVRKGRPDQQEA